jgi:hypothetical protein
LSAHPGSTDAGCILLVHRGVHSHQDTASLIWHPWRWPDASPRGCLKEPPEQPLSRPGGQESAIGLTTGCQQSAGSSSEAADDKQRPRPVAVQVVVGGSPGR